MAKRQDFSQTGHEDVSLGALLGLTPHKERQEEKTTSKEAPSSGDVLQLPLRLRLERKGHRGKDVTVLQGLGQSPEGEALVKTLKGVLGCGGRLVDGSATFQGDQRTRLIEELRRRGAKDVK